MDAPDTYRGVTVPTDVRRHWGGRKGLWWRMGVVAKAATVPFDVFPGQVYADNDPRHDGRSLRVDQVRNGYAYCTVLTNSAEVQAALDEGGLAYVIDKRGTQTKIKIRRLYPNARGYRRIDAIKEPV